MPGTTNASSNIKELYDINNTPGRHRSRAQIIAIGLSEARQARSKHPHDQAVHAEQDRHSDHVAGQAAKAHF